MRAGGAKVFGKLSLDVGMSQTEGVAEEGLRRGWALSGAGSPCPTLT